MIIILAIGLVFSIGFGALASHFFGEHLPIVINNAYGQPDFLFNAAFYAAILMAVFFVIALIMAIVKQVKKVKITDEDLGEKLGKILNEGVTQIKEALTTEPTGVLEDQMRQIKSLLTDTLEQATAMNETVPLLKRINTETEEAKTKLAVNLKDKCAKLTELAIENEKLEKNNYALRKVIDDALVPFCDVNQAKSSEYRSNEYRGNNYRPGGNYGGGYDNHNYNQEPRRSEPAGGDNM